MLGRVERLIRMLYRLFKRILRIDTTKPERNRHRERRAILQRHRLIRHRQAQPLDNFGRRARIRVWQAIRNSSPP